NQNLREKKLLRSGKKLHSALSSKISKIKSNRRRTWKISQMKQAIEMVKSDGSKMIHAAHRCKVPLSTLSSYIKQGVSINHEDTIDDAFSETMEEIEDNLSEAVSENGIETISVSSSSSATSKISNKHLKKFVLLARKSTSPFRLMLKQPKNLPGENMLDNFEQQTTKEKNKNDFGSREQFTITENFIDSIILNKNKVVYLNGFEKPIKLYAYLSMRQKFHPLFLTKNLSYLTRSRPNFSNPRRKFKVDDLLEIKMSKSNRTCQNELSLKLDTILIHNKEDKAFINKHLEDLSSNDSISVQVSIIGQGESVSLAKIAAKNIQIVNQNGLVCINVTCQFIPLRIENLLKQNFKSLTIDVQLVDKKFHFSYMLADMRDFFKNSPKSTPSKSNFFDFTFKLNSDEVVKHSKSIQSLIDSFNSSNLIKLKVKVTRSSPMGKTVIKQQAHFKNSNVFYQFSDASSKKLITRTNNLSCQFCYSDSFLDYTSLIKQTVTQNGVNTLKLDLSLDDTFDGSYCGNLHDLIKNCHLGYSKSRMQPTRQISVDSTEILCNRRSFNLDLKRLKTENLSQQEMNTLNQIQQQLIKISCSIDQAGQQKNNFMQRVYYHTMTNQPVHIDELEYDSDSEMDTEWLKQLTTLLINDFADVNEGEKEFMKLWNLHCLRQNFVADSQLYSACEMFINLNLIEYLY
ncbi:Polycomb suz12, partial [Brachionus plicatilis]